MKTYSLTPLKPFKDTKSRLSGILTLDQRVELSRCMLKDVFEAITHSKSFEKSLLVTSERESFGIASEFGIEVLWEEKASGVNSAVEKGTRQSMIEGARACIVIPADLPLLSPGDIRRIVELANHDDEISIVISPSLRLDGTNILLRKPPDVISTWYDAKSFENHLAEAVRRNLPLKIYLKSNVVMDIDSPEDLRNLVAMGKPSESPSYSHTYNYLVENSDLLRIGERTRP